jgi:hypothetical protein
LDPWGKWKHVLYLDPESLEKVRELQAQGVKNVLKKDEEGYYTTFSRPGQKVYKGIVKGLAPPEILDGSLPKMADGSYPPMRPDVMVGNGSDITTVLEVYEHGTPGGGKAKAARWLSSIVFNLVPFVPTKDYDEEQKRAVKPLADVKEPLF